LLNTSPATNGSPPASGVAAHIASGQSG